MHSYTRYEILNDSQVLNVQKYWEKLSPAAKEFTLLTAAKVTEAKSSATAGGTASKAARSDNLTSDDFARVAHMLQDPALTNVWTEIRRAVATREVLDARGSEQYEDPYSKLSTHFNDSENHYENVAVLHNSETGKPYIPARASSAAFTSLAAEVVNVNPCNTERLARYPRTAAELKDMVGVIRTQGSILKTNFNRSGRHSGDDNTEMDWQETVLWHSEDNAKSWSNFADRAKSHYSFWLYLFCLSDEDFFDSLGRDIGKVGRGDGKTSNDDAKAARQQRRSGDKQSKPGKGKRARGGSGQSTLNDSGDEFESALRDAATEANRIAALVGLSSNSNLVNSRLKERAEKALAKIAGLESEEEEQGDDDDNDGSRKKRR